MENFGISLNTDILETGLINILALLAILVYAGQDFLGSLYSFIFLIASPSLSRASPKGTTVCAEIYQN